MTPQGSKFIILSIVLVVDINDFSQAKDVVSLSTFRNVFNESFSVEARFMKCKGNHTYCDICINCNLLLTDSGRRWPPAADNIIKRYRALHLKQQYWERRDADERELMAKSETDLDTGQFKYFYICADFVSNSAGDTPRFVHQGRFSKEDRSKAHIQSRMCGAHVICGPIDELFVYFTDNMMPGGTNTMIQIMRMAIHDLTIKLHAKELELPRNAFFQMDNCPSENKNLTIFGFMSLLVDLGYFETIQLNYLVVGHTHCPIDQKLGAMTTVIDQHDFIATPEALKHLLTEYRMDPENETEGYVIYFGQFISLSLSTDKC